MQANGDALAKYEEGVWSRLVSAMADDLGHDFSGVRAHAALELHMRECAERRAEDRADRALTNARLNSKQESFDKRMSELTSTLDKRMTAHSNRMWAAAIGLILTLLATVAFLIPHYVGKVPHP
jgi:hypothetical protein